MIFFHRITLSLALCFLGLGCARQRQQATEGDSVVWAQRAIDHATQQYHLMADHVPKDAFPRALDPDGSLVLAPGKSWVSGFFPGTLWYLHEYSRDPELHQYAIDWTTAIESQKYNTGTHDLGFMFLPSYGNAYRIDGDPAYREVLLTSAASLAQRFHPVVGCVKSWDFFNGPDKWQQFPVIIDNMMNLELLFEATRLSGDSTYHRMAVSHADKTLKNHLRADYSTYHVVDYDTLTGAVIKRMTSQGLADESTWARGQAWAVAGFTLCYRYTADEKYLDAALNLYQHYAHHKNMPEDNIPYWDFDDPLIPHTSRDASAAAVIATALLELQRYVNRAERNALNGAAKTILQTLSSDRYLTAPGGQQGFILQHSTGHRPQNSEVDVPICYADYYYVKALTEYLSATPFNPESGLSTN